MSPVERRDRKRAVWRPETSGSQAQDSDLTDGNSLAFASHPSYQISDNRARGDEVFSAKEMVILR